jgi:hypothetical protein
MTQARENLQTMIDITARTEADVASFELKPSDFGYEGETCSDVPAETLDPLQRVTQIALERNADLLLESTANLLLHEREMAQ